MGSTEDTCEAPSRQPSIRRVLKTLGKLLLGVVLLVAAIAGLAWWYFHPTHTLRENVVYTQREGSSLTYDVVTPESPNGAAILVMVSGSWKSGSDKFSPWLAAPLLRRGFTVFAVSHLSQPKALVSEIVDDIHRAVRHIRFHAVDYGIDPRRIGVTGGSSGGHLSLMLATRGAEDSSDSIPDPIDRESSAVQAVAVFFPVTDLVDLGPSRENPGDGGPPMSYVAGFGFKGREDDPRRIRSEEMPAWNTVARALSPIHHIGRDLPPILIHHGDADTLVPLDQSERFLARARELGLGNRIELVIHPRGRHGWLTMIWDVRGFASWFEDQLL